MTGRLLIALACILLVAGCVKDENYALIAQAGSQPYTLGADGPRLVTDEEENGDDEEGESAEAADGERPAVWTLPQDKDGNVARPPEPSMSEEDIRERTLEAYQAVLRGMHGVRWQTRTTFPVPGAYTLEILHLIRTDINGDRIRDLRANHRRAPTMRTAGDDAMAEADAQRLGSRIADLVYAYTYAPAGLYQRLIREGRFGRSERPGWVTFSSEDFLMPGDTIVLSCRAATGDIERIEFTADLDGQRLLGLCTFRDLPTGAAYPYRTDVSIEGTLIKATVENFGHQPERR